MWELKLFGQFQLKGPVGPIEFGSVKLRALLAYLALLGPRGDTRERVTCLLWGSHFEEQARQNFRQALTRLRKVIGSETVLLDDQLVTLSPGSVSTDVARFEALVRAGSKEDLRKAVGLAEDAFMSGMDVQEAAWEEWVSNERRRLATMTADALVSLGEMEFEHGDTTAALGRGKAVIGKDFLREDAHRLVMRSLAKVGRRTEALRHFQAFSDRLKKELATTPETATVQCSEALRADTSHPGGATVPQDAVPVPIKPSIAVLPFVNMSGDVEQEYFSDGMTEDLITALSKIHWFFVIARTSTFAYKGRSITPEELGRELGVRYVLEGSVRKGGNRVRISAQLVDAMTGHHVWAERYDRDLEDIFALQDEMIETIIRAIEPELGWAERERARRKPPGNLNAWELFQRGLWHNYRFTKADNAEAERCFHRAIEVDPTFALPFAALAHACYWDALFGYAADVKRTLADGLELAQKAVSLDDREPFAHFSLGRVQTLRGEFDSAIAELEQAIDLNPNFSHAYFGLGIALVWAGKPAQGINRMDTALRLNPRDPSVWTFQAGRALALFFLDRLDEAADWAQRSARSVPTGLWSHGIEAAVLAQLGREREAAAALAQVYRLKPDFSADFVLEVFPFRLAGHRDRFLDGLRKAGLPE